MTRDKVYALVVASLRRFADAEDIEINGDIQPVGDLGLDSPDGIDWACEFDGLGFRLPHEMNPFVDDDKDRARTVDEIVDLMVKYST